MLLPLNLEFYNLYLSNINIQILNEGDNNSIYPGTEEHRAQAANYYINENVITHLLSKEYKMILIRLAYLQI